MSRSAYRPCIVLGLLFGLAGLLAGCNHNSAGSAAADPTLVVATTGMIGDLAQKVAGNTAKVEVLMGPGVDPHLYQPKQSDLRKLEQAKLVLYNGLHLEGNMVEFLEHLPRARAVTKDMPVDRLLVDEGQPDPHVWFDVSLWILALDYTEKALIEAYPQHAQLYQKNAAAYRDELKALHGDVQRDLATIPKPQRVLVTAHDAFRYFGRAYDVDVVGLQGISTADEPGRKEVQRVVDRVVEGKIKAIFTETSVPADGIQAVVDRCRTQGHTVNIPEGKLYSDAMDEPGTLGGTYPGMVRHNVQLIVNALR